MIPALPIADRTEDHAPSIYDVELVERVRKRLRLNPGDLRRLRIDLLKHAAPPTAALATLPSEVRRAFTDELALATLTLSSRHDSAIDGATKLLFKTAAGFAIETVILRAGTGRTALCVSSQIGCAAKCDFCATGRMGVARDLSAGEILDQVTQANRLLRPEKRRARNIVFMGMGEPLHNERAISDTLDFLIAGDGFHHPPSRILLSTVGVVEPLLRTAERFPQINYALSLHAADQATRERIIPLARRYPLEDLRDAVRSLNEIQGPKRPVMLEYLMLEGVNASLDDAERLVAWADGLDTHVNLIPYNHVADAPHLVAADRNAIEQFGKRVRSAGFPTTIRYSMGRDIDAACGQLVRNENRALAAAASAGFAGPIAEPARSSIL